MRLFFGFSLGRDFRFQVFHLRDVQERPRFLSKSFLGFLAFNVITYSLLIAELVITNTQIHSEEDKVVMPAPGESFLVLRHQRSLVTPKTARFILQSFFSHLFNGCYAVLMFIVVVFFLIYGVEVYFKVGPVFSFRFLVGDQDFLLLFYLRSHFAGPFRAFAVARVDCLRSDAGPRRILE